MFDEVEYIYQLSSIPAVDCKSAVYFLDKSKIPHKEAGKGVSAKRPVGAEEGTTTIQLSTLTLLDKGST